MLVCRFGDVVTGDGGGGAWCLVRVCMYRALHAPGTHTAQHTLWRYILIRCECNRPFH